MKSPKLFIILLLLSAITFSCSSDDDGTTTATETEETEESSGNYFPYTQNSYWNYEIERTTSEDEVPEMSNDSLYVETQMAPDFTLGVNGEMTANGIMSGILTNGTLTNNTTTLVFDGGFDLPEIVPDLPTILFEDFVLYNTESTMGTELSSTSDTITQELEGIPLTINYTVKTIANGTMESMELNGMTYTNLVSSSLIITIEATATVEVFGFPVVLDVLDSQDLLVGTYIFSEDVGLVKSTGVMSYEINETALTALTTAGIDLPLPATGSQEEIQVLTDYIIEE